MAVRKIPVVLALLALSAASAPAALAEPMAVTRVTSLAALQSALDKAASGDRIELADGTYTASQSITIGRSGVTVAADNVGKAEIRGSAGFAFSGSVSQVVVEGFALRHSGTISIPAEAKDVRFTRNTIQLAGSGNWLTVYGNDAEIDHNTFADRSTEGVFLQVSGPDSEIAQGTHIHHNYFFNHTFSGKNGGESIRLGYSHKQAKSAEALVEHNLFDKANGDAEAISVKSSDNVVRHNTIVNSKGFLVLRHGHRNLVDGNVLLGSGIRFHGNDHRVINNYVNNSAGRAVVFGSGAEADSAPDSKLHDRPDRVTVAFNTLLGGGAVVDSDGGEFKPKDCVLANNIIQGSSSKLVDMASGSSVRYEGNIVWGGTAGSIPSNGYRSVDPKLVTANGLSRLGSGSPAVDAAAGSYPYVKTDFDPHARSGKLDVGADEFGGSVVRKPLTKADVGPLAP